MPQRRLVRDLGAYTRGWLPLEGKERRQQCGVAGAESGAPVRKSGFP